MVYVSLQHLQSKTNPNFDDHHDNLQVTNWAYLIPNLVLPIFVSQEKPQASKEEISASEVSHPPSDSSPNEILVIRNLDDDL